jgi:hypothetical protein
MYDKYKKIAFPVQSGFSTNRYTTWQSSNWMTSGIVLCNRLRASRELFGRSSERDTLSSRQLGLHRFGPAAKKEKEKQTNDYTLHSYLHIVPEFHQTTTVKLAYVFLAYIHYLKNENTFIRFPVCVCIRESPRTVVFECLSQPFWNLVCTCTWAHINGVLHKSRPPPPNQSCVSVYPAYRC